MDGRRLSKFSISNSVEVAATFDSWGTKQNVLITIRHSAIPQSGQQQFRVKSVSTRPRRDADVVKLRKDLMSCTRMVVWAPSQNITSEVSSSFVNPAVRDGQPPFPLGRNPAEGKSI